MNILNRFTAKMLWKNKTRTIVTIIGIVLSAAMFVAVTCTVTSLQRYMLNVVAAEEGSWYGKISNIPQSVVDEIAADGEISNYTAIQMIGYAEIGSSNENKPYLFIEGVGDGIDSMLPITITEGRMPETEGEILLPNHLAENGAVYYRIGDVLNLEVGQRVSEGFRLNQGNAFYLEEDGSSTETLENTEQMQFVVVGFYNRPCYGMEEYAAPGYTALTVSKEQTADDMMYQVFFQTKHLRNVQETMKRVTEKADTETVSTRFNNEYLRYTGNSTNDNMNSVFYGFAAILIVLIVAGSISLIYNAFFISVGERTKQFGILKSVGATKRQMKNSVLFEGLLLCVIGIPLGVGAGIGGMAVTFACTKKLFGHFLTGSDSVSLTLHVNAPGIIIAVCLCLFTVLISAYIPAKRAAKKPAIEAIRQSADIRIRAKKIRTSRLTYKLFHFEGMLASKNYKRNKKRYRATIVSLALSIILFIASAGFCDYLTMGVTDTMDTVKYDLFCQYYSSEEAKKDNVEKIAEIIANTDKVTESIYYRDINKVGTFSANDLTKSYLAFLEREEAGFAENGRDEYILSAILFFVEDEQYQKFMEKYHLDASKYGYAETPAAVAYSHATQRGSDDRYYGNDILKDDVKFIDIDWEILPEGTVSYYEAFDEKTEDYLFYLTDADGNETVMTRAELTQTIRYEIGVFNEDMPFAMDLSNPAGAVYLVYPYSVQDLVLPTGNVVGLDSYTVDYLMTSLDAAAAEEALEKSFTEMGLKIYFENIAEVKATINALVTLLKVFSYGFITLISLIAVANVFNTISTNVGLRRREFAMLRSVGMTQKGFRKMMNFECILYGAKGLLYGLPIAFGFLLMMHHVLDVGYVQNTFYVPWKDVAVAVFSVFLVVFVTMLYSMNKIKKDNPVETLKNENL